jgi:SAM-dependent methyltransferase
MASPNRIVTHAMNHGQNTMDTLHGFRGGEAERRKLVAAAAERNQHAILEVIMPVLNRRRIERASERVDVLEVASGTGQHAFAIAKAVSEQHVESGAPGPVIVHPSDLPSEDGFGSIRAYAADHRNRCVRDGITVTMEDPIALDCSSEEMVRVAREGAGVDHFDLILCVNMTHIAPIQATEGLIASSGELLRVGGELAIYGPFTDKQGRFTTESNRSFDASLRARNPQWGYRSLALLDELCGSAGLRLETRLDMPANNVLSIYHRA